MERGSPRSGLQDHAFVVLAYERSPFLAACLASLQAQTHASRILLATSTPNAHIETAARAGGFELAVNPVREGLGGDFNFALRVSGARYVTLVHQDDVYLPQFLEETRRVFAKHPQGALSFTGYREISGAGDLRSSKVSIANHTLTAVTLGRAELVRGWRCRAFLSLGCAVPCSSVTFDLEKLGWLNFAPELTCCLDWDAWWRVQQRGEAFLRVREPLVHRRYHALTETSQAKREGRRQREDLMVLRQIWPPGIGELVHRVYSLGY